MHIYIYIYIYVSITQPAGHEEPSASFLKRICVANTKILCVTQVSLVRTACLTPGTFETSCPESHPPWVVAVHETLSHLDTETFATHPTV